MVYPPCGAVKVTKPPYIDALAVPVKLWHYVGMLTEDMLAQAVTEAESGQKILQFLERRLKLPSSLLHRWIRTGQVRCNGGRCKPFARVKAGDMVRLPPFAFKLAAQMLSPMPVTDKSVPESLPLPPVMGTARGLVAYAKPRGLPTQPGTGHDDSLASRLAAHHADALFVPAPVHRLDKDTSGLLLVATTHDALRRSHEDWREGRITKRVGHRHYQTWKPLRACVDADCPLQPNRFWRFTELGLPDYAVDPAKTGLKPGQVPAMMTYTQDPRGQVIGEWRNILIDPDQAENLMA